MCISCVCILFFFFFFNPFGPTLNVRTGSLKATKGNSTSVCTFSTAPLELFSQIRFWLHSDVKKQNKQTRRNKDKKKDTMQHFISEKGFFFFFQASPASNPPFSPCQLWPHSGGEVAWGGVGWAVGGFHSVLGAGSSIYTPLLERREDKGTQSHRLLPRLDVAFVGADNGMK